MDEKAKRVVAFRIMQQQLFCHVGYGSRLVHWVDVRLAENHLVCHKGDFIVILILGTYKEHIEREWEMRTCNALIVTIRISSWTHPIVVSQKGYFYHPTRVINTCVWMWNISTISSGSYTKWVMGHAFEWMCMKRQFLLLHREGVVIVTVSGSSEIMPLFPLALYLVFTTTLFNPIYERHAVDPLVTTMPSPRLLWSHPIRLSSKSMTRTTITLHTHPFTLFKQHSMFSIPIAATVIGFVFQNLAIYSTQAWSIIYNTPTRSFLQ